MFAPTTGRTPLRARHRAPRTPFRVAVRHWFADRRKRAVQAVDVPTAESSAVVYVVPTVTVEDALVRLAVDSRLFGWDTELVASELGPLVPHLHPSEAKDRFHGLQNACEGRVRVLAALGIPGADDLSEAVAVARPHWDGLVEDRIRHLFAPTVAFNDDGTPWTPTDSGSQWTAQATGSAVAA